MIYGFIIPAIVNYWVVLPIIPLLAVGAYYGRQYVVVSREVSRIQALSYSFVLTHFSNTEQGLVLIRTYGKQHQITDDFYRLVNFFAFCLILKQVKINIIYSNKGSIFTN